VSAVARPRLGQHAEVDIVEASGTAERLRHLSSVAVLRNAVQEISHTCLSLKHLRTGATPLRTSP
jgi:hypothetical protein